MTANNKAHRPKDPIVRTVESSTTRDDDDISSRRTKRTMGPTRKKTPYFSWRRRRWQFLLFRTVIFACLTIALVRQLMLLHRLGSSLESTPTTTSNHEDGSGPPLEDSASALAAAVDRSVPKTVPPAIILATDDGAAARSPPKMPSSATGSARILLDEALRPRPVPDAYSSNNEDSFHSIERRRCARYGLRLPLKTSPLKKRRRIFWGSLIADDSWHTIAAVALETYGVFHTAAFVESNRTQTYVARDLRFGRGSENERTLKSLFGPDTKVSVDYFVDEDPKVKDLLREHLQRDLIIKRWKANGMTGDDLGLLTDCDETFTRDFLRATQVCDIPQFADSREMCRAPKVNTRTLVFEGSPDCVATGRWWWHPDMIIGKCIDTIGDSKIHLPAKREYDSRGWRKDGYTQETKFRAVIPPNYNSNMTIHYPLWNAADFRRARGSQKYFFTNGTVVTTNAATTNNTATAMKNGTATTATTTDIVAGTEKLQTGFHFHNFFVDAATLRRKYGTYAHPVEGVHDKHLGDIHRDLTTVLDCFKNDFASNNSNATSASLGGRTLLDGGLGAVRGTIPVAFRIRKYVDARHEEMKAMLMEDVLKKNRISSP